ncbi:quinon protein alcohol dehydrogenase-like superfamily [Thamnocephalis sphaerospora]|uniref:Quinon protein alcohol dehydrogenase-like superfamily n=1 Tax=Thamnocephalis sphaerospora TaxID=78915 RepID=A0A4P9XWC9_9FUNG|nr:quinon protein alcohol dehydrogenase-like superfamily [Thamnocephalis sphaerospora]|eukprot:RKP09901.1 quinon protein alcohol dehydrogenase-like superfamily [Thamnocephalis sphaerospora]
MHGTLSNASTNNDRVSVIDNRVEEQKQVKDVSVINRIITRARLLQIDAQAYNQLAAIVEDRQADAIIWRTEMEKCIDASPVVVYAYGMHHRMTSLTVYVGSHSGLFLAVDATDASLGRKRIRWSTRLPDRIESSACISSCQASLSWPNRHQGCYNGCLYVMNALDGGIINCFASSAEIKSSPAVDATNGNIWFGSHDGHLYCVRIQPYDTACTLLGKLSCGSPIFSSCTVDTTLRIVVTGTLRGELLVLDADVKGFAPTDLRVCWRYHLNKPIFSSPAIDTTRRRILVGCADGNLYCLGTQGDLLWKYATGGPVFSSPCITHDAVLVGTHAGALVCCDVHDGALRWRSPTDAPVYASPTAVFPESNAEAPAHPKTWQAIFASIDGRVYTVDQQGEHVRLLATLPGQVFGSPLCLNVPNGATAKSASLCTVLVGCRDNGLYAVAC